MILWDSRSDSLGFKDNFQYLRKELHVAVIGLYFLLSVSGDLCPFFFVGQVIFYLFQHILFALKIDEVFSGGKVKQKVRLVVCEEKTAAVKDIHAAQRDAGSDAAQCDI